MNPGFRRLIRTALLTGIRCAPLSWAAKCRLLWLAGPKFLFAACGLIQDEQGRLLVLRSRYTGDWQFPGGCANRGETALGALRRECMEETGLEVQDARLVGIYVDMHGLSQCALFRCRVCAGSIRLSEEHTAYRYAEPELMPPQLRRMLVDAGVSGHI